MPMRALSTGETLRLLRGVRTVSVGGVVGVGVGVIVDESFIFMLFIVESLDILAVLSPC